MVAPAPKRKPDPVAEAAAEALRTAKGDVHKASTVLEKRVRKEPDLREALTEPLIASACFDAVRAVCRKQRRIVWSPPTSPASASAGQDRVVHLAAGTLMMFPLPGGKRLGDATREDVAAAGQFYAAQSADMAHKARWLQLVAQSLPDKKKVRDVLSDERLRDLQMEASKNG